MNFPRSNLLILLVLVALWAASAAADECRDCHNTSVFKVKHKAMYDYHVGFGNSVHGLVGLSCADCHGGDPDTKDEELAHAGVRERVKDPRVPATCGACHQVQYEGFIASDHFLALEGDKNAPNCATCHGSMEMDVMFVSKVRKRCLVCHDDDGDPDGVAAMTDELLSEINAIRGFRGRLETVGTTEEDLTELDRSLANLQRYWHGFDLEMAAAESQRLLQMMREMRINEP